MTRAILGTLLLSLALLGCSNGGSPTADSTPATPTTEASGDVTVVKLELPGMT